jgi:hypothetical protein
MALTMTRTRTQTTLTKLAELVANVHGELAFVEGLLAQGVATGAVPDLTPASGMTPEVLARLALKRLELVGSRYALYATLRQFDGGIEPERIGALDGWTARFGRKGLGTKSLVARYLTAQRITD